MFKRQNVMRFVNMETLLQEHQKQSKRKATGIDNVTKDEYDVDITRNITDLLERMKLFRYRPQPVRRTYIPKANGKLRPLGIPAYEDKLVQGAMANILSDIYEGIFLDCSYGFRPGRSCHDVVREINHTVMTKKVNYVLEADIKTASTWKATEAHRREVLSPQHWLMSTCTMYLTCGLKKQSSHGSEAKRTMYAMPTTFW